MTRMYLKNPDWDMDVNMDRASVSGLTDDEQQIIEQHRRDCLRDLWAEVIDGEYLDIRLDGEHATPAVFNDNLKIGDVETNVADGEYVLDFNGGYSDDWHPWFEPWAMFEPDSNHRRGAVRVMLFAVVTDGKAIISVFSSALATLRRNET